MNALKYARWFLEKEPDLLNGYLEQNMKLNKLLYFSNLMYYAVHGETFIDEKFEHWDRGPVLRNVNRAYRYEGLDRYSPRGLMIEEPSIDKVMNIVDSIYGNKTAKELSDETHHHNLWQDTEQNEEIDFSNADQALLNEMKNNFDLYKNTDFDLIGVVKVKGNVYFYEKENLIVTDDIISLLKKQRGVNNEPQFIEDIDGTLVFS